MGFLAHVILFILSVQCNAVFSQEQNAETNLETLKLVQLVIISKTFFTNNDVFCN